MQLLSLIWVTPFAQSFIRFSFLARSVLSECVVPFYFIPALFSSTVYTYVFHRHISDGSFHVASETKAHILPGIFNADNATIIDDRADELLTNALLQVPVHCLQVDDTKSHMDHLSPPPVLIKVSPDVLQTVSKSELDSVLGSISRRFQGSGLSFSADSSIGTLKASEEKVLQWFSINLLNHSLRDFSVYRTGAILTVGSKDLEITLAVASRQEYPTDRVVEISKLSAFGHLVKLITLKYPLLGMYEARFQILKSGVGDDGSSKRTDDTVIRSQCMNPISEATWAWSGKHFR